MSEQLQEKLVEQKIQLLRNEPLYVIGGSTQTFLPYLRYYGVFISEMNLTLFPSRGIALHSASNTERKSNYSA